MAQEKNFEKRIVNYIQSVGGWVVKYFANSYTKRGIPDLLACVNGHFIAIEVKASNGRPSELQKRQIELIKKSGGIAVILYPSDFDDFKEMIKELL